MLATEGTGRCAPHRPPHARCLWLLDFQRGRAPQRTTHRFREPKKIRRARFWTGTWRVSRCVPRHHHHHPVPSRRVVAIAPIPSSRSPPATTPPLPFPLLYRRGAGRRPRTAPKHYMPPRLTTCDQTDGGGGMLQASSERPAGLLWVPGMTPWPTMDAGSARAQEIARRREEMLGMLHDLPESEYELSLTDLVEKAGGDGGESEAEAKSAPAPAPKTEGKDPGAARSAAGGQQQAQAPAGRPERKASARRRDSGSIGGGSFRSSSDGVLLNFYMPRSLTRSFTAPRHTRTASFSGCRSPSVASDCNKRERDPDVETVKCWSLLWDRRWRKSSRQDPGPPPSERESSIRAASAAILKAAKHSAPPAKI